MCGLRKGWMSPVEEQEVISKVASTLADKLPEGWKFASYLIMAVGAYSISQLRSEDASGKVINVSVPVEIVVDSKTLRAGMYKENKGTWFTWELAIRAEGEFRSVFDYDNPPPFLIEPGMGEYRREGRLFPRSLELTPDWLQGKFDEIERRLRRDPGIEAQ